MGVFTTPAIEILLGVLQKGTGHQLFQMFRAHILTATISCLYFYFILTASFFYLQVLVLEILEFLTLHFNSRSCTIHSPQVKGLCQLASEEFDYADLEI